MAGSDPQAAVLTAQAECPLLTLSGHSPAADQRQTSAKSRHSRTGRIGLHFPLIDPIAQPEPDFQFDQTLCW